MVCCLTNCSPRSVSQIVSLFDLFVNHGGAAVIPLGSQCHFEKQFLIKAGPQLTKSLKFLSLHLSTGNDFITICNDGTNEALSMKQVDSITNEALQLIGKDKFDYVKIVKSVVSNGVAYLKENVSFLDVSMLNKVRANVIIQSPKAYNMQDYEWGFSAGGTFIVFPNANLFIDTHKAIWKKCCNHSPARIYRDYEFRCLILPIHEIIHCIQSITTYNIDTEDSNKCSCVSRGSNERTHKTKNNSIWYKEYQACMQMFNFAQCVADKYWEDDGLLEECYLWARKIILRIHKKIPKKIISAYTEWRDTFGQTDPDSFGRDSLQGLIQNTQNTFYIKWRLHLEGLKVLNYDTAFHDFLKVHFSDNKKEFNVESLAQSSFAIHPQHDAFPDHHH